METIAWFQVVPALLGGGAAGALINAFITTRRARIQPIGHRIEVIPVFRHTGSPLSLTAKIAISHDDNSITFDNLFLANIQIVNRGNRDIDEFPFGITLGHGDSCIHIETSSPDRHHVIIQKTAVNPQSPQSEIDFILKPFNRRDSYLLRLYLVVPKEEEKPKEIILGSSYPIRFTAMPTIAEVLIKATEEVLLSLGPFRVILRR